MRGSAKTDLRKASCMESPGWWGLQGGRGIQSRHSRSLASTCQLQDPLKSLTFRTQRLKPENRGPTCRSTLTRLLLSTLSLAMSPPNRMSGSAKGTKQPTWTWRRVTGQVVRDWFGSQEWTNSCSDLARNTYLRGKGVVGKVAESELRSDVADTVSAWSKASAGAIGSAWSAGYRKMIGMACAGLAEWSEAGR